MAHRGVVKNGRARLVKGRRPKPRVREQIPSLYDQLKPVIGAVQGLPRDLALNHDFYLHGLPRK
jgi:hypothetical protein